MTEEMDCFLDELVNGGGRIDKLKVDQGIFRQRSSFQVIFEVENDGCFDLTSEAADGVLFLVDLTVVDCLFVRVVVNRMGGYAFSSFRFFLFFLKDRGLSKCYPFGDVHTFIHDI